MYILGISAYYHDSAASLIKDGQLIAAAAEERFNRIKHYNGFPSQAIKYCLSEADITADQIDYIGSYEKPLIKFERILSSCIATFPWSYRSFISSMPIWLKNKLWIKSIIQKELDTAKEIIFAEHHLSHAASAFLVSPFDRASILTIDGVGEWATTTLGLGNQTEIRIERELRFPHSLGLLYATVTSYLGFRVNDDEWKVMGLAAYGRQVYLDKFEELIDIKDDGSFRLDLNYFAYPHSISKMFNKRFERHFGQPQRKPEDEITQFHKDIACSVQKITENIIVKIANYLHQSHHSENLCIAGGVGLNSVANWQILQQTPFKRIFIQPAAGDDGGALGVAFFIYHILLKNKRSYIMNNAYLGPGYSNEEIKSFLDDRKVKYEELSSDEIVKKTARLIFQNNVVGWFQGRMEFGPRALGNRSILANPLNPDMKDIINKKVKYREDFRPFAPSVLKEAAPDYFEMDCDSPYMLLVPKVKQGGRNLPAVTHVDGTARVHTVAKEENEIYYNLIKEFGKLSGIPVLLNTSFNIKGEPIVCAPADAYNCFMKTEIDYLALGAFLIAK